MLDTKTLLRETQDRIAPPQDVMGSLERRRQRQDRNRRVAAGVLGIAVFVLAAVGFVRLLGFEGTPASDPQSPFAGTWVSTSDSDGGTQTMTVQVFDDGAVEIVVADDVATVCSGTPSTMTGTGRIEAGTRLVIPAPVYTCDDGSEPETLSGPPLREQLRDWTLVLDAESDTLSDGVGGVWLREGAEEPSPDPLEGLDGLPASWDPSRFGGTWGSTAADTGFLGTWESTDSDGKPLLLGIRLSEDPADGYEVLLLDGAETCSFSIDTAAPIAMTGIGQVQGRELAIDPQSWFCEAKLFGPWALLLAGLCSGLALWTHLMSASAVAAAAAWLLVRFRGRRWLLVWAFVPLVAASAPFWTRLLRDTQATRIVQVADRQESTAEHLASVLPRLHEPIGGVLGTHVPVIADAEDFMLQVPGWRAGALVLLYGIALILAVRATPRSRPASLYLLAAVLAVVAFPFPVRAAPHTIRFLTPLFLPVAALIAWAAAPGRTSRRAWILVLALAALHLAGATQLLEAWRATDRAQAPFLLPDLRPVVRALDANGVRHAYASYGPAFRLTWESGERIVASPPWNDRFRHWPLPLLDEVRFAKNVAWLLTPAVPSALPAPGELERALARIGGRWRRQDLPGASLFLGFVPPFSPAVSPWPGAKAAGDLDLRSFIAPAPQEPLVLRLPEPRPLAGVTLLTALDGPRLPRSFDVEVSADGERFELVASRRRREERQDLRWLNGHPQAVLDHDAIAIDLGGRPVVALRITPWRSGDSWRLAEVLIHDELGRNPWDEWLSPGLDWEGRRRALVERPRPDREDWYARVLLAARHQPAP